MRFLGLCLLLCLLAASPQTWAKPIPDAMLNKDYESCLDDIKDKSGVKPEQGQMYCECIRKSMKLWTLESYEDIVKRGKAGEDVGSEERVHHVAMICAVQAFR